MVFFLLEYRTVQLVRNFLGVIVVDWVLDLGFLFPDLDRLLGFLPEAVLGLISVVFGSPVNFPFGIRVVLHVHIQRVRMASHQSFTFHIPSTTCISIAFG